MDYPVLQELEPSLLAVNGNLQPYIEEVERYRRASRAQRTNSGYATLWNTISAYVALHNAPSVPMDERVVANVLGMMARDDYSVSHIRQAKTLISLIHRRRRLVDPTRSYLVEDTFRGICRIHGSAPKHPKWAFTEAEWDEVMRTTRDVFEKAVLAVGKSAALRRSELVALTMNDQHIDRAGMTIVVRRSKCDQTALGEAVEVARLADPALCPVAALEAWLVVRPPGSGPLFPSSSEHKRAADHLCDRTVLRMVQRAAARRGLDPNNFGAHSLRATCATHMIDASIPDARILAHMRHKWLESLAGYYRPRHFPQRVRRTLSS